MQLIRIINSKNQVFEKEASGLLTKRGTLELVKIINEFVLHEFKPKKEELLAKRVKAFKEGDWKTYEYCIGMAAQEMQNLTIKRT